MIWSKCVITKPVTETDRLGNQVPTGAETIIATTQARKSPFTAEELAADGRRLTRNQQRYILPLPFTTVKDAQFATIGGLKQTIVEKQDLEPRWSVITVEAFKV